MTKLSTMRPALRQRLERQLAAEDATKNYKGVPITFNHPPGLFRKLAAEQDVAAGKKIRQGEKPLNKLESAWLDYMRHMMPGVTVRSQSIRLRISNGAWYKCDHAAVIGQRLTFFECKGGAAMKGNAKGILAVKVAASTYPEFTFFLVWKVKGAWQQQQVKP